MKIAIIGTGISGLTCAYKLHRSHDITVYEANDYIGGHTATIDVEVQGQPFAVDTGFIVYNDRTYPNFIALMNEIGVKGTPTEMSFSVRNDENGLEYNGHTLTTLFAQKRNWLNPKFYHFIWEILRFNKMAKVATKGEREQQTLGEFLDVNRFSDYFSTNYILPMGAAIWSSTLADMRAFPLQFFCRFFLNHGLLDVVNRPQWYVVNGGSRSYIKPLTKAFADNIRLSSPVQKVAKSEDGVWVEAQGKREYFDQVIFACHSDQALAMIEAPSEAQTDVLTNLAYQANEVVLHTDTSLLPKRKAAWASWNYWLTGDSAEEQAAPKLTYNMNILQHIDAPVTFCVSLNSGETIDPAKILRRFEYHHPVFNKPAMEAQRKRSQINGLDGLWFCGAYWYNGFHEDGVRSALDVVEGIGKLPQKRETRGAA
ncbi:NAD(P)/FAD-dependent oxidoreductase [Vibrio sonorensis]|uniref:NAD(P)/FAD-dependent oxidoreductase n=1 Tax=Vibrio sonorensis TaxID=1004316 RepID=UPI0008DA5CD5|nr:NAD(P)/FAD-dependent oxidoreductase [Vibrio sonorensis]